MCRDQCRPDLIGRSLGKKTAIESQLYLRQKDAERNERNQRTGDKLEELGCRDAERTRWLELWLMRQTRVLT